jgi:uroporphyrinogen decarboxylase
VNSRERVMAALHFQGPDRCPVKHFAFPGAFRRHGQRLVDLMNRYPDDFGNRYIRDSLEKAEQSPGGETENRKVIEWKDAWGVTWRRLGGYTSGDIIAPAIPDWDAWRGYRFPAPPDQTFFDREAARIGELKKTEYVPAGVGAYFQHLQHLRGPSNMLMDIGEDHEGLHELADRLVEHDLVSIRGYLAAGADGVGFGDDLGSQDRLLVSPQTWRRFFKPRYARMFEPIRDAGKDVWFHSDGWILEIIDDLIEIGVNYLNPQHEIMDTWRVADVVRGRACIGTDLDRQWAIPFGKPEDVIAGAQRAIAAFGANGGGVILHGEVGPEVPLENIEAMWSAFYRLGTYPLTWLPEYLASVGRPRSSA